MHLFFRQLGFEFLKLFSRRRTWLGFAGCLLCEGAVLLALNQPAVQNRIIRLVHRAGYAFEGNFSGLTVAASMMGHTMTLVGALFLALVAGDILAKETEDGTLRTSLCRPVTRHSLFFQKLIVCVAYTVILNLFIGASALAIGLIDRGPGNLLFWSIKDDVFGWYDFSMGLKRFSLAVGLLTASTFTITTAAFFFSSLPVKPAAATALALGWFLIDESLRSQESFAIIRPWSLATHIVTWLEAYRDPLPWPLIIRRYSTLLALDFILLAGAWLSFRKREFKT